MRNSFVLSIFWWFCFPALQAAQSIRLTPIPSLPQLPVSAIHRIFQDSEGMMWYGTVNGLCRDDGYQVDVIRSDIAGTAAQQPRSVHLGRCEGSDLVRNRCRCLYIGQDRQTGHSLGPEKIAGKCSLQSSKNLGRMYVAGRRQQADTVRRIGQTPENVPLVRP